MRDAVFEIVRDQRGSLVHVRTQDGECIGCIEAGLYEIVRALVLEERAAAALRGAEDADRRSRSECMPLQRAQVL